MAASNSILLTARSKNFLGQRIGKLRVVEHAGRDKHGNNLWKCLCDCGREKITSSSNLAKDRSCGCGKRTAMIGNKYSQTHGLRYRPEHKSWGAMLSRCYRPKDASYARYGGRGIVVCDRWRHSFPNFLADMGPRPGPGYSVERKDSDGNYEPGNCLWATAKTQARNRSDCRMYEFQGAPRCISEIAELIGIRTGTLIKRLDAGWTIERATTTPVEFRRPFKMKG